jgi:hypothetical protein
MKYKIVIYKIEEEESSPGNIRDRSEEIYSQIREQGAFDLMEVIEAFNGKTREKEND